MTTQIKAGVIAANAVNSSELASGALSGQNFTGDITFNTTTLKIDSSNNRVGIGTSNPTFAGGSGLEIERAGIATLRLQDTTNVANVELQSGESGLHIRVGANGSSSDLFNVSSAGTSRLLIDNSGNVGIGTTSPQTELEISAAQSPFLRLTSEKDGNHDAGDVYGELQFFTQESYGNAPVVSAKIAAEHTRAGTGHSNADAGLVFYTSTATGDATATERMRIESATGNVGIGTTSPDFTLEVEADKDTWVSRIYNTGSDANAQTLLVRSDATAAHDATVMGVYADSAYKMVIKSTGNVGIGTSSPQTDLNIVNSSGATLDINTNTGSADSKILLHEGTSASPANGASIRYDGANNLFKIGVGSNVDTTRLTITRDTGNVGINETSPNAYLHVTGKASYTTASSSEVSGLGFIRLQPNSGSEHSLWIHNASNNLGISGYTDAATTSTRDITLQTYGGNVGIGDTSPQDYLEINGSGRGLGGLTISNDTHNHAALSFARSSTATARIFISEPAATHTSQFNFQTSDASGGGANLVTAMVIDENQNVGIGTTDPQYKFDVYGTDDVTMRIHRPSSGLAATDTCGIGFSQRGDTTTSSSDTRAGIFSTYNGDLFLAVEAGGNLNSNPMDHSALFIEGSNGKVGIGTTSPSSTLTANGTIESLKDDTYGSNEGGQIMLRSPSNTTTSKRYSFDTFNVSNASVLRLISEDDSDGANGIVRMALDTKGTFLFTNGTSSFAHNTYAHSAVFSRNSTPLGTVVIEDSDVSSGIGNTVLNCYLRDQDPASFAIFIRFTDGGGTVGSITHNDDGGGVTYNTTSDYRLKENVNYDWDGLSLLNQLKPAKFNFIRQPSKTLQGFLAHEVKDIVPSSVQGDKDHMEPTGTVTDSDGNVVYENVYEHFCKTDEGQTWTRTGEEPVYQELDYSRLVPLLTKAIQEQQTIIDDLKSRIETLEG